MTQPAHRHGTAPGELALVHAFLNTCHADGPRERFDSPERLQDWLAKRSLIAPDTQVSRSDYNAVRQFRDALRELIAGQGNTLQKSSLLNRLAQKAPLIVRFDETGTPLLSPAGTGVPAAIATILARIMAGAADGTWYRLKLCRNAECQRVFYDTTKNHSAVWCSSQHCGNRMAARAYRARARGDADA
jgi:predicted RNA-binding Zn ribbon-like protein